MGADELRSLAERAGLSGPVGRVQAAVDELRTARLRLANSPDPVLADPTEDEFHQLAASAEASPDVRVAAAMLRSGELTYPQLQMGAFTAEQAAELGAAAGGSGGPPPSGGAPEPAGGSASPSGWSTSSVAGGYIPGTGAREADDPSAAGDDRSTGDDQSGAGGGLPGMAGGGGGGGGRRAGRDGSAQHRDEEDDGPPDSFLEDSY